MNNHNTIDRFSGLVAQLIIQQGGTATKANVEDAIAKATLICNAEVALSKRYAEEALTDHTVRTAIRVIAKEGREASDATFALLKAYFTED